MIETINVPGKGAPQHRHARRKSFRVIEGRYLYRVDGRRFFAEAGDVVSIPEGAAHGFVNVTDKPACQYILIAPALDRAAFFTELGETIRDGFPDRSVASAATQGWRPGRLVLVGSPAQGSAIAGRFQNTLGYGMITGPCGAAVTPAGAAAVAVPDCEGVLVIAGGTGNWGYNPLLRGDNDGLIAVAETRLHGYETGFLLTRARHKSLPTKPETISACVKFLETGKAH